MEFWQTSHIGTFGKIARSARSFAECAAVPAVRLAAHSVRDIAELRHIRNVLRQRFARRSPLQICRGAFCKILRFATDFAERAAVPAVPQCLRFAPDIAEQRISKISFRQPFGIGSMKLRISAARYVKYMFSFWGYRPSS